MEEKTTIVIDVQLDDNKVSERLAAVNKEMEGIKAQNKELKKSIKEGNDEFGKNSRQLAENEAKLKTLKAEQSALSGQVAQATQANRTYGTSLKEQSALLNDLRNRYQSLNKEQRESDGGKKMLAEIQELDAQMKGADGSIGLYQRNVGDYANQIAKISGLFGSAGGAASSFAGKIGMAANGLTALTTIPILAVLTLLISVVKKAADAMKGSEAQTMRWKETMAVFEPLINAVKNGLSALAAILIDVVQVAIKGVTAAMDGLAKATDWVGKLFGKDWGISAKTAELREQAAAQRDLTKAENEYTLNKRAFSVESAKMERDIADLRAKAADSEKYTAQERKKYLQEALETEKKRAAEQKRLAEENLANLRARAALTENDAEMNDKLAEAEIAVINADKELAQHTRRMNSEMKALNSTIANEGKAAMESYKQSIKEVREELGKLLTELPTLEELAKKNQDQADNIKKAIEPLQKAEEYVEIAAKEVEEMPDISDKFEPNKMEQFAAAFSKHSKTIEQTSQALGSSFGSLSSIYQQMAEDETKSEAERAKAAKKAKTWSALQIAANSGTAIAKGIAGAMDTPFPANIAALATTLAAVLSAIAQAKALASQSFETGGVIGGYKGASMGKDNTVINARNGEMVINANQQRRLYDIANGSATSSLTASLVAALSSMPAPVLDYKEFTAFGNKVTNLNEFSKLK